MVDFDIDPDVDAFVAEMVGVLALTEQYQAGPENRFGPPPQLSGTVAFGSFPGFQHTITTGESC